MNIENSKYLIEKFDLLNGENEKTQIINYEINHNINNTFIKEKLENMKLLRFVEKKFNKKKKRGNDINELKRIFYNNKSIYIIIICFYYLINIINFLNNIYISLTL